MFETFSTSQLWIQCETIIWPSYYLYRGFPPDDIFVLFGLLFWWRIVVEWCLNHNTMYARSSIVLVESLVLLSLPPGDVAFVGCLGKPSLLPPPMSHGSQANEPRTVVTVTVLTAIKKHLLRHNHRLKDIDETLFGKITCANRWSLFLENKLQS